MIKLKTDCTDCMHSKICRYKHNARSAMDKLKKEIFTSEISNDAYTWEDTMARNHVDIEFSCPDYKQNLDTVLRKI